MTETVDNNKEGLKTAPDNVGSNELDDKNNQVTKPGLHDVLLGRGGGTNNHSGNIKFRKLVNEHKLRYLACSKIEKPKVAREVVQIWRKLDPPGRFLARLDDKKRGPGSVKDDANIWYEVGDKKAREKASQCLRERTRDVMPYLKQLREQQDQLTEESAAILEFQYDLDDDGVMPFADDHLPPNQHDSNGGTARRYSLPEMHPHAAVGPDVTGNRRASLPHNLNGGSMQAALAAAMACDAQAGNHPGYHASSDYGNSGPLNTGRDNMDQNDIYQVQLLQQLLQQQQQQHLTQQGSNNHYFDNTQLDAQVVSSGFANAAEAAENSSAAMQQQWQQMQLQQQQQFQQQHMQQQQQQQQHQIHHQHRNRHNAGQLNSQQMQSSSSYHAPSTGRSGGDQAPGHDVLTLDEYQKTLESYLNNNQIESLGQQSNDNDANDYDEDLLFDGINEDKKQSKDNREKRRKNITQTEKKRGVARTKTGESLMSAKSMKSTSTSLSIISGLDSIDMMSASLCTRESKMNMARSVGSNYSLMSELTDMSHGIDNLTLLDD